MNQHSELNPKFRFETFVVGPDNLIAHIAATVVSDSPGKVHNPLAICSSVGLGKSHLLQAIGNRLLINFPDFTVFHTTSDAFMNQFINTVRREKKAAFRKTYKKMDVLLFDDFQFIANKEMTQEEVLYLFGTLLSQNKQIVIACCRSPLEIQGIDEQLKSMFLKGHIVHMNMSAETKMAVLIHRAELERIALPPNVSRFLADHLDDNIRTLEGAIMRLAAHTKTTGEKITINLAHQVLHPFLNKDKPL